MRLIVMPRKQYVFRTGAGDLLNCRQVGRLTSATSLGVCRVQLEKREWNTHRDHYSRFVQGTRISNHSITLSATCLPAHIPEENRKDKSFLLIPQFTFKWNKLHARTDIIDDGCGKSKNHICLIGTCPTPEARNSALHCLDASCR